MKVLFLIHLIFFLTVIPDIGLCQYISLSGYVTNSTDGNPMQNVSIYDSNSEIGTITNQNGFYKLQLKKGSVNLSITKIGFNDFSNKLILKADTTLQVKLEPNLEGKNKLKKNLQLQADAENQSKKENREFRRSRYR
ncbi:MAG: carboxypeptidase-like regulatory domain-containing protein [Draconibacterium sp.]|nr:carboxypeptidase-like regulatory domain-containing protein [Draconibacterium sp.]